MLHLDEVEGVRLHVIQNPRRNSEGIMVPVSLKNYAWSKSFAICSSRDSAEMDE